MLRGFLLAVLFAVSLAYPQLSDLGGSIGVPRAVSPVLTAASTLDFQQSNQVIEGKLFVNEALDFYGENITLRNCRFIFNTTAGGGYWAIQFRDRNPVIDHVEIIIRDDLGVFVEVAFKTIYDCVNFTFQNSYVVGSGDGMQISAPGTVTNNYIKTRTALSNDTTGWHHDGIQFGGGALQANEWLILTNNNVFNANGETSCISLFQDYGPCNNIRVQGNCFTGGGYSLYGGAGNKGNTSNLIITDNLWSTAYHAINETVSGGTSYGGGYFGPVAAWDGTGVGDLWFNNTWLDGAAAGKPVLGVNDTSTPAPSAGGATSAPSPAGTSAGFLVCPASASFVATFLLSILRF